jgi:hypothetical protein
MRVPLTIVKHSIPGLLRAGTGVVIYENGKRAHSYITYGTYSDEQAVREYNKTKRAYKRDTLGLSGSVQLT